MPSAQPRRDVPHGRSLACSQRHARRRSVPGRGDLPGLLRLRAVRAVEPQRGPAVQAHADLRRARARAPGRPHAEGRARAGARVLHRRSPSSSAAASCTSTRSGASTPRRRRAGPAARRVRRATARRRDHRRVAEGDRPRRGRRRRPVRVGRPARRPRARARRRSARGGARGGLHRQVRDQVDRGRRRRHATGSSRRTSWPSCAAAITRAGSSSRRGMLGARPARSTTMRMRRWAHQFGFGGHCFTKSRRFSTTFKALREARAAYAARAPWRRGRRRKVTTTWSASGAWRYAGRGYPRPGTRSWRRQWPPGRASSAVWRMRRSRSPGSGASRPEDSRWCGSSRGRSISTSRTCARRAASTARRASGRIAGRSTTTATTSTTVIPSYVGRDDVKRTLRRWTHPNTQRKNRAILVSFYDWAMEEGYRKDNPARQTRPPKSKPPKVYRLTRAEVAAFLAAAADRPRAADRAPRHLRRRPQPRAARTTGPALPARRAGCGSAPTSPRAAASAGFPSCPSWSRSRARSARPSALRRVRDPGRSGGATPAPTSRRGGPAEAAVVEPGAAHGR